MLVNLGVPKAKDVAPSNGEQYEKQADSDAKDSESGDKASDGGIKPFQRPDVAAVKGDYIMHLVLAGINFAIGVLAFVL